MRTLFYGLYRIKRKSVFLSIPKCWFHIKFIPPVTKKNHSLPADLFILTFSALFHILCWFFDFQFPIPLSVFQNHIENEYILIQFYISYVVVDIALFYLLHLFLKDFWNQVDTFSKAYMICFFFYEIIWKKNSCFLQHIFYATFSIDFFSIQAGQYTEAYTILEELVEIENTQLGERPEELADIFQLMAKCKSEVRGSWNPFLHQEVVIRVYYQGGPSVVFSL